SSVLLRRTHHGGQWQHHPAKSSRRDRLALQHPPNARNVEVELKCDSEPCKEEFEFGNQYARTRARGYRNSGTLNLLPSIATTARMNRPSWRHNTTNWEHTARIAAPLSCGSRQSS